MKRLEEIVDVFKVIEKLGNIICLLISFCEDYDIYFVLLNVSFFSESDKKM